MTIAGGGREEQHQWEHADEQRGCRLQDGRRCCALGGGMAWWWTEEPRLGGRGIEEARWAASGGGS